MQSKRDRAFTLIELIVVILIIAIMSAVVVPAYQRFYNRSRFDSSVASVQDIFAFASEQAVTNDTEVVLHFDRQSETFTVTVTPPPRQSDGPVALTTSNIYASNGPTTRTFQLNPEFGIVNFNVTPPTATASGTVSSTPYNPNELHFQGDGTVEGLQFTMESMYGYGDQLTLWPANGRLIVKDLNGPQG